MGINFCTNNTELLRLQELFTRMPQEKFTLVYKLMCPPIIVVCCISIILNAGLMLVSRQSKLVNKSPILLLSMNLAITDLIAALSNGLSILINSYLKEVFDRDPLSSCTKLKMEVIRHAALIASTLHLLALAVVHYRGSVDPFYRSRNYFSKHLSRKINIISLACWIIPLIIMTILFYSYPCQGFQSDECGIFFMGSFTYKYLLLSLFLFPLTLMSVIYVRIFIIISRHQKGHQLKQDQLVLSRGVLSASTPLVAASPLNMPQLMDGSATQTEGSQEGVRANDVCISCNSKARVLSLGQKIGVLIEKSQFSNNSTILSEDESISDELASSATRRFVGKRSTGPPKSTKSVEFEPSIATEAHSSICDSPGSIALARRQRETSTSSPDGPPHTCDKSQFGLLEHQTGKGASSNLNQSQSQSCNTASSSTWTANGSASRNRKPPSGASAGRTIFHFIRSDFSRKAAPKDRTSAAPIDASKRELNNDCGQLIGLEAGNTQQTNMIGSNIVIYESQRKHLHASAAPPSNIKALITTLLILGTYIISYVPAILWQVLTCYDHCPYPIYDIPASWRIGFGTSTTVLLIAKAMIDPLIYSYRMNDIQRAIKRYLSVSRSKTSSYASSSNFGGTSQRFHNTSVHFNGAGGQMSQSRELHRLGSCNSANTSSSRPALKHSQSVEASARKLQRQLTISGGNAAD